MSLKSERIKAVITALINSGSRSVVDIGCGDGTLIKEMMIYEQFESIIGLDLSNKLLGKAHKRLGLDQLHSEQTRVKLIRGSLTKCEDLIVDFDAATAVEVIEHLTKSSLLLFEEAIFALAKIRTVIVTTPNYEYNVMFGHLLGGKYRNKNHRFEFTLNEFRTWALDLSKRTGYQVVFSNIGPVNEEIGAPTQMAIFQRYPFQFLKNRTKMVN